uniref:Uncharacterized protein n=1 Tax=Arundo donax TaxID=35708 RepID=A0A0A9GMP2_ARUDO
MDQVAFLEADTRGTLAQPPCRRLQHLEDRSDEVVRGKRLAQCRNACSGHEPVQHLVDQQSEHVQHGGEA